MLSHQIKNSGSLIDSIDAIRNWRAVCVLLATLVCMALVVAFGGVMAQFSFFLAGLLGLAAYALLFYGANAVGMMMMDEARGLPSRPAMQAVADSLATSHRLILVFLLLGALYLAGFVVLAIVLLICRIPFFGPLLYTVVFPVSVVVAGLAMFAVPTVVFPLSAPAIWGGARTMQCVSQLLAIARTRLVMVLLLMLAVSFIATLVGILIGAILFAGTAATALVSVPILGGMPGVIPEVGRIGLAGAQAAGMDGHALAAMTGGGMLVAVAFTLPGMVYLRGASAVYLRAIDGLDLASEQATMDEHLAAAGQSARNKARDLQAQAQAVKQKYAPAPATAAAAAPIPPAPAPPAAGSAAPPA